MTDKELLELAAKAAGIYIEFDLDDTAYLSNDYFFHGVPVVTSRRRQLRITARPKPEFMDLIGSRITLEGWGGYRGGLDVTSFGDPPNRSMMSLPVAFKNSKPPFGSSVFCSSAGSSALVGIGAPASLKMAFFNS